MLLPSQICWWARELATHHVVCLLWGLGCRVLCWRQSPDPRGELLVALTSCSELELLILSPSAPSLFSRCPPIRTSSSTKFHSRNADNGHLIDFFCRICRCRCSAGCFWHGYWFQIPPAHWRGYRDCYRDARPTQGLTVKGKVWRAGPGSGFQNDPPQYDPPPVKWLILKQFTVSVFCFSLILFYVAFVSKLSFFASTCIGVVGWSRWS